VDALHAIDGALGIESVVVMLLEVRLGAVVCAIDHEICIDAWDATDLWKVVILWDVVDVEEGLGCERRIRNRGRHGGPL